MKKLISLMTALVMLFSLSACGGMVAPARRWLLPKMSCFVTICLGYLFANDTQ